MLSACAISNDNKILALKDFQAHEDKQVKMIQGNDVE